MNKPYISASVGRNGRNRPVDVAMIQSLLNEYFTTKVDGLIGMGQVCSLCEAIEQFQQDVVGMKKPDGFTLCR